MVLDKVIMPKASTLNVCASALATCQQACDKHVCGRSQEHKKWNEDEGVISERASAVEVGLESSVSMGDSARAHYFHQFNHQHANDCRHYCPAEITQSLMIQIDSILMAGLWVM